MCIHLLHDRFATFLISSMENNAAFHKRFKILVYLLQQFHKLINYRIFHFYNQIFPLLLIIIRYIDNYTLRLHNNYCILVYII